MSLRPALRSTLCLCAMLAGLLLGYAFPTAFAHFVWGGFTVAIALFLLDPPQISIRVGRQETPVPTLSAAADLQEQAQRLDLKDHALRERERRVREKESALSARASELLRRENELSAEWARLRGEASRTARGPSGPDPRLTFSLTPEEWLGVEKGAAPEEIRAAWAALAKAFHPDRVRGLPPWAREDAERRMKAINEAYELLRS